MHASLSEAVEIAQQFPVVRCEQDQGLVQLSRFLQRGQDSTDLIVHEGDRGIVVGLDQSQQIQVSAAIPILVAVLQTVETVDGRQSGDQMRSPLQPCIFSVLETVVILLAVVLLLPAYSRAEC